MNRGNWVLDRFDHLGGCAGVSAAGPGCSDKDCDFDVTADLAHGVNSQGENELCMSSGLGNLQSCATVCEAEPGIA